MEIFKNYIFWLILIVLTLVCGYFLGLMISTTVDYRLKNFTLDLPKSVNKIIISKKHLKKMFTKDTISNKKIKKNKTAEKHIHKETRINKTTNKGVDITKDGNKNNKMEKFTNNSHKVKKGKRKVKERFINFKEILSDKKKKKKILNTCDTLFSEIQNIKDSLNDKTNVDYKNTIEKEDMVHLYSKSMNKANKNIANSNNKFNILAYNKEDLGNMYELV